MMCHDTLRILPQELCFPIFYRSKNLNVIYEPTSNIFEVLGNAYFIHIWDEKTFPAAIDKISTANSTVGYIQMAQKFCPSVLKAAGEWL